jgi:hypothetical protein
MKEEIETDWKGEQQGIERVSAKQGISVALRREFLQHGGRIGNKVLE